MLYSNMSFSFEGPFAQILPSDIDRLQHQSFDLISAQGGTQL